MKLSDEPHHNLHLIWSQASGWEHFSEAQSSTKTEMSLSETCISNSSLVVGSSELDFKQGYYNTGWFNPALLICQQTKSHSD